MRFPIDRQPTRAAIAAVEFLVGIAVVAVVIASLLPELPPQTVVPKRQTQTDVYAFRVTLENNPAATQFTTDLVRAFGSQREFQVYADDDSHGGTVMMVELAGADLPSPTEVREKLSEIRSVRSVRVEAISLAGRKQD